MSDAKKTVGPGTTFHRAQENGFSRPAAIQTVATGGKLTEGGQALAQAVAAAVSIDDAGAARLLAREFEGHVLYLHASKSFWLCGDDGYWFPESRGEVTELAKARLAALWAAQAVIHRAAGKEGQAAECYKRAARAGNRGVLRDALDLLKSCPEVARDGENIFDQDIYRLGVQNGVIELRTGEMLDVAPEMALRRKAGCKYVPAATCPQWLEFLRWCFAPAGTAEEVEEFLEYVRRVCGILLTGDRSAEKLLFLHGSGSNGKSTFAKVVKTILGAYACTAPTALLNTSRHGRTGAQATPDLIPMIGSRLAICNETADGAAFDSQIAKSLASNEELTARPLYGAPVSFTPVAMLVILGNHKPRFNGADGGMARRIDLLPFLSHVPASQRDPGLLDRLMTEAEGILTWMVSGAIDWYAGGRRWPRSAIVERASTDYQKEMDPVARWIDEVCVRTDQSRYWLPVADARGLLTEWMHAEGHQGEFTQIRLTQRLAGMGFTVMDTRAKGKKVRKYRGLALAEAVPLTAEEVGRAACEG